MPWAVTGIVAAGVPAGTPNWRLFLSGVPGTLEVLRVARAAVLDAVVGIAVDQQPDLAVRLALAGVGSAGRICAVRLRDGVQEVVDRLVVGAVDRRVAERVVRDDIAC